MSPALEIERLLTPKDVGLALSVNPKTARRLPNFPWRDIGTGKRRVPRCRREDFERWLANRRAA